MSKEIDDNINEVKKEVIIDTDYVEKVNDVKRIEREKRLTKEDYLELLMSADPELRQIRKTRYCLSENGYYYEIDILILPDVRRWHFNPVRHLFFLYDDLNERSALFFSFVFNSISKHTA